MIFPDAYNKDDPEDFKYFLPMNSIAYWKKGCKGSEYYKGEVFDEEGNLVSVDTDEDLLVLVSRLKSDFLDDTFTCGYCGHTLTKEVEHVSGGSCINCVQHYESKEGA